MLAVAVLTLLLTAQSMTQASDSVGTVEAELPRNKWLPAAASEACVENLLGHGEEFEIPARCRLGYGRHSNGRCYRVVDELPEDGTLPKHAYQVTRLKRCVLEDVFPAYDQEMESQGRLDICDEDGGCYGFLQQGALPGNICRQGFVRDANGVCRRSLVMIRNATRRPPKQGRK